MNEKILSYTACLEKQEILGSGSDYCNEKTVKTEEEAFDILRQGRNHLSRRVLRDGKVYTQVWDPFNETWN